MIVYFSLPYSAQKTLSSARFFLAAPILKMKTGITIMRVMFASNVWNTSVNNGDEVYYENITV